MNPLDGSGPAFLALYIPLFGVSLLAGIALRWWLRRPGAPPGMPPPSAPAYEVALLRGREALIEAAVASLVHKGLVRAEGGRLMASGEVPVSAPLIEHIVHTAMRSGSFHASTLLHKVEPAVEELRGPLEARGWLLEETRAREIRLLSLLAPLAVQALGLAKLMVGIAHDRPVTLLVFACGWGGAALFALARVPWCSRLGDRALSLMRMEHPLSGLNMAGPMSASSLSSGHVALVAGLFGLTAVGFDEFADVRREMESFGYSHGTSASGGGGGDSGGCGGGGCGGCGGGCS
jgi:uncharacterized protein (TIGR04222 family)